MDTFAALNSILVKLFNDILNIEEKALITEEFKDISVTDMHIIEAIGIAEPRTMSMISKSLGLVRKGYVVRNRSDRDRRIVYASLTEKGIAAYHHHMKFHKSMIDSIMQDLSEDEAVVLNKTFKRLETFFGQWTDKH